MIPSAAIAFIRSDKCERRLLITPHPLASRAVNVMSKNLLSIKRPKMEVKIFVKGTGIIFE